MLATFKAFATSLGRRQRLETVVIGPFSTNFAPKTGQNEAFGPFWSHFKALAEPMTPGIEAGVVSRAEQRVGLLLVVVDGLLEPRNCLEILRKLARGGSK